MAIGSQRKWTHGSDLEGAHLSFSMASGPWASSEDPEGGCILCLLWEAMVAVGGEAERSFWSYQDDKDCGTLVFCDSLWEVMAVFEALPLRNTLMGPQPCTGRKRSPNSDECATQNSCNQDRKEVSLFPISMAHL